MYLQPKPSLDYFARLVASLFFFFLHLHARLLLIMRLRDGNYACDMVHYMKAGTDPSRGPSPPWVQIFFFFFYSYYIYYFCSWTPFQNLRSLFSSISLISLTQIATIQPKNLTIIIIKKFTIVIVF